MVNSVLNVKVVVAAFNQEKDLVGAFSEIVYNFTLHPPLAGVALAVLVVEAGAQHRQRRPAAEVLTSDQLEPGHLIMTLYVHNNPQYNDPVCT